MIKFNTSRRQPPAPGRNHRRIRVFQRSVGPKKARRACLRAFLKVLVVSNGLLESRTRLKLNRSGRFDLNFLARLRIDTGPCRTLSNGKRAEANQLHGSVLFYASLNRIKHGCYRAFCGRL